MEIKEGNVQKYFNNCIKEIKDLYHKGNNKLFLVKLENNKEYLLKQYSTIHMDNFSRGKTEFSTLSFLWERGFREVPQPVFFDEKENIGIYSFEKGKVLDGKEVKEENITNAVDFLVKMHNIKEIGNFSPASSACFSFKDYLEVIERRLSKMDLTGEDENERKAMYFLNKEVKPKIEEVKAEFIKKAEEYGMDINEPLSIKEQVITPADFGFHNILVKDKDHKFLDFEYFGRDDPARQVLDFLHHAKSDDIKPELKEAFIKSYCDKMGFDDNFKKRLELLSPLVQITWVLICLNILSKSHLEHLKFAHGKIDGLIEERLKNAKKKLDAIQSKNMNS